MLHNVSLDTYDEHSFENDLTAALIIFIWSQIGLAVNIFAIVLLWKNKHMRNAFGYLCLSHEIGDIGCLLLYAFWAAPMTLFQIDLSHEFVGKAFGQFGILMWNVCVYSHLFITINRFLAIFFPFGYRRCFKGAVTVAYLGLMWFVAICNIIPYFFDGCYFSYIPDLYLWMFAPTTCGMALLYNDFLVGIAFMIVMVIVDSITYIKIYLMKRQMQSSSNRREIRFFIQACCQGCLFVCKLFTFYFLSTLNDGRWYKFATTTLVWQSAHVFDGLILILFNSEFERMLTGKTPLSSYTTHVNKRGRQSTYTYSAFTKPMTTDVTVSHL